MQVPGTVGRGPGHRRHALAWHGGSGSFGRHALTWHGGSGGGSGPMRSPTTSVAPWRPGHAATTRLRGIPPPGHPNGRRHGLAELAAPVDGLVPRTGRTLRPFLAANGERLLRNGHLGIAT